MTRALIAASAALFFVACGGNKKPDSAVVKAPAPTGSVTSEAAPAPAPVAQPAVVERAEDCTAELTVYFPLDVAALDPRDQAALRNAADCLRDGSSAVRIKGHADPRGTEAYNLGLAERRAQAVKRYLTALGVADERLEAVSYGEVYARGDDPASWKFDRRAEIELSQR